MALSAMRRDATRRDAAKPVGFRKRKNSRRGKSRYVCTASSADKAAVFQKQAPNGEKHWPLVRERNREKDEAGEEKKAYIRFRERTSERWGQFTRETHANARPRVRELRRGRYNTVPIVRANHSEITKKGRREGKKGERQIRESRDN